MTPDLVGKRTRPRLTCQLTWCGEKCGYEADSYSELRAHMEAAHK